MYSPPYGVVKYGRKNPVEQKRNKRVTIAEIAKEVGVSPTTVSFALNNKIGSGISKRTKEKVVAAAIRLGYLTPTTGASDRFDIAIMLPDITNPSFTRFMSQISNYAFQSDIGLLVCNTGGSREIEREHITRLLERNISGILYVFTPTCDDLIEKASKRIPIVVVGDSAQTNLSSNIAVDNYEAALDIARHLYGLGHRRVAYITTPINAVSILRKRRLDGLRDYFAERGCADSFYVYEQTDAIPPSSTTSTDVTIGQNMALRAVQEHPEITAIIALGDMLAVGVYEGLRRCNIRIPEDISVASFDDIEFARYLSPTLTTVDTKLDMRSKFAFDYLTQLITEESDPAEAPLYVSYRCTLCKRDSTGPARPDSD